MMCKDCPKIDWRLFLSDPPKMQCTVTGKFHASYDVCDVDSESIADIIELYQEVECLICGEPVPLLKYEIGMLCVKVCDKCRCAIMGMRKKMEE